MSKQGITRWLWMMILILSNIFIACLVTFYICELNPRYNYVLRKQMYDYLYWGDGFALKRYMEVPFRGFLPPLESKCGCNAPSITNPPIYIITPTHKRLAQKVDLTIYCQTLSLVKNVVWIVVEDSASKTDLVTRLLSRCPVKSVHLTAESTRSWWWLRWLWYRNGITQWNTGLKWLRSISSSSNCEGVVYFSSDNNKFHVKLFDNIRTTKTVSIWPVQASDTSLYQISLPCQQTEQAVNDTVIYSSPLLMSGMAVNLCLLMKHPEVTLGTSGSFNQEKFLGQLLHSNLEVECKIREAPVWNMRTQVPTISQEEGLLNELEV